MAESAITRSRSRRPMAQQRSSRPGWSRIQLPRRAQAGAGRRAARSARPRPTDPRSASSPALKFGERCRTSSSALIEVGRRRDDDRPRHQPRRRGPSSRRRWWGGDAGSGSRTVSLPAGRGLEAVVAEALLVAVVSPRSQLVRSIRASRAALSVRPVTASAGSGVHAGEAGGCRPGRALVVGVSGRRPRRRGSRPP